MLLGRGRVKLNALNQERPVGRPLEHSNVIDISCPSTILRDGTHHLVGNARDVSRLNTEAAALYAWTSRRLHRVQEHMAAARSGASYVLVTS